MLNVRRIGLIVLVLMPLLAVGFGTSWSAGAKGEVRMGYLNGAIGDLAFFVGQDKNIFKNNGVDITLAAPFNSGTPMMDALAANKLDMAYVGISPPIIAAARNVNLSIIAGVVDEYDALIVDKTINNPADLRGKKIATPAPGSVQYLMMAMLLAKHNLSFKDVEVLPGTINPPDMAGALANGNINGYIAWEPFVTKSILSGAGKVLLESKDVWPGGMMGGVIVTDNDFARKNPEVVTAVVRAHKQANEFIRKNVPEAKQVAMKWTKLDANVIDASWPRNIFISAINTRSVQIFAEQMIALGESGAMKPIISRSSIPNMETFLKKLVDSSYLNK